MKKMIKILQIKRNISQQVKLGFGNYIKDESADNAPYNKNTYYILRCSMSKRS